MNRACRLFTGTAAAAAMMVSAAPAMARDHDRDRDGISAGEVIAGAVVLGGIAAIAASAGRDRYDRNDRYDRHDGYYGDYDYRRYGSRQAIDQCVRAVRDRASRYGRARVTDITQIDRTKRGYRVEGRVAVRDGWRDRDYGRGDRDYRWGGNDRGRDYGSFACSVRYGQVDKVRLHGLDRW